MVTYSQSTLTGASTLLNLPADPGARLARVGRRGALGPASVGWVGLAVCIFGIIALTKRSGSDLIIPLCSLDGGWEDEV